MGGWDFGHPNFGAVDMGGSDSVMKHLEAFK